MLVHVRVCGRYACLPVFIGEGCLYVCAWKRARVCVCVCVCVRVCVCLCARAHTGVRACMHATMKRQCQINWKQEKQHQQYFK